jgi:hypothetical protein
MDTTDSARLVASYLTFTLLACGEPLGSNAPTNTSADDEQTSGAGADGDGGRNPRVDGGSTPTQQPAPTPSDEDGGTTVCETLEALAQPNQPRVLVVVDRSGSMAGDRWTQVTEGVAAILTNFGDFSFGLSLYPAIGEELDCKAGKLDVAPREGALGEIRTTLLSDAARALPDNGYTPTAATLEAARESLVLTPDDERERYVLLVTDGKPNCKLGAPNKYDPDEPATYDALDSLLAEGVRTFVIGYQTAEFASIMDTMAVHGGTQRHYAVESGDELQDAIKGVASSLAPCSYELEKDAPGAEYVRVLIDGREVAYGANGFTVEGRRRVLVQGAACDGLRDGKSHGVQVLVECQPVRVL